jgi:hypothetical protein
MDIRKFMKYWCFYEFCFLPTLRVLFLSIVLLTSSGDPHHTHLIQISKCVSKSLLVALKDKGKHPTMLLSGESGSNKKLINYYIALLEWTTIFFLL